MRSAWSNLRANLHRRKRRAITAENNTIENCRDARALLVRGRARRSRGGAELRDAVLAIAVTLVKISIRLGRATT